MTTLNGTDLGNVKVDSQSKDSGLFQMPMPLSDSDKALLMDIYGTSRSININGTYTGTKSEIVTFVGAIETLQNGNQGSGFSYVGDLMGSKTVLIQTFQWDWEEANLSSLNYTLSLIEGTSI